MAWVRVWVLVEVEVVGALAMRACVEGSMEDQVGHLGGLKEEEGRNSAACCCCCGGGGAVVSGGDRVGSKGFGIFWDVW